MKRSRIPALITVLVLIFLHAPLVVLVVNSFNESRFGGEWEGFTTKWYDRLWAADEVWESLLVTLKIAVSATVAATSGWSTRGASANCRRACRVTPW